jgi:hypothetical protein
MMKVLHYLTWVLISIGFLFGLFVIIEVIRELIRERKRR